MERKKNGKMVKKMRKKKNMTLIRTEAEKKYIYVKYIRIRERLSRMA